jgi:hypothetical protein
VSTFNPVTMDYNYPVPTVKAEPLDVSMSSLYNCSHCHFVTESIFELEDHVRQIHSVIPSLLKRFICTKAVLENYKCSKCDFGTQLLVDLNEHLDARHHKPDIPVKPDCQSYNCRNCHFQTWSQLVFLKTRLLHLPR